MLRVLLAEDSPLFARAMTDIVHSDPELRVVGVAGDGAQAVALAERLRPDVITMDIQMPVMDGLEAIGQIMAVAPTPILVVTGDPAGQRDLLSFEALRRGALDLIVKPETYPVPPTVQATIVERLKFLATVPVLRHVEGSRWRWRGEGGRRRPPTPVPGPAVREAAAAPQADAGIGPVWERPELAGRAAVVGVVASTGGPAALAQILERLPPRFPASLVVVQHIARGFVHNLAHWLAGVCALGVRVAEDRMALEPATLYLAPDDYHLVLARAGVLSLDPSPAVGGHRPSGTKLLESVARAYGRSALGVVLSGMGDDGVRGLRAIRDAGGVTLAQDQATSVVYGMPGVAHESGAASYSVSLADMARTIGHFVGVP